jgi:hypothetical protein
MRQRVLTVVEGKDSERLVVMKEANSETAVKEIFWVRVSISESSHDHDRMNGCFVRNHKSTQVAASRLSLRRTSSNYLVTLHAVLRNLGRRRKIFVIECTARDGIALLNLRRQVGQVSFNQLANSSEAEKRTWSSPHP